MRSQWCKLSGNMRIVNNCFLLVYLKRYQKKDVCSSWILNKSTLRDASVFPKRYSAVGCAEINAHTSPRSKAASFCDWKGLQNTANDFRLTKAGNEEPQDERSLYETIKLCDTILGRKPYVLGALFSSELDGFGSSFSSRSIGPAKPDPLGIGGGFSCCCSGTSLGDYS